MLMPFQDACAVNITLDLIDINWLESVVSEAEDACSGNCSFQYVKCFKFIQPLKSSFKIKCTHPQCMPSILLGWPGDRGLQVAAS